MYLVMTIHDNVPKDIVLLTADRKKAMERFLELCKAQLEKEGNGKLFTGDFGDDLLNEGYLEVDAGMGGCGSICYLDLTNAETDEDQGGS